MRVYRLRIDVLICLGLAFLLSLGTGKLTELIWGATYEGYAASRVVPAGEIGGPAEEDLFRARDVEDLLSHETFTVTSSGIEYRNRGGGYYGRHYFNLLTLPSGELVAACINADSIQYDGEFYTADKVLPVGRVVWEDLSEDPTFLDQIQSRERLSRTDFYIDMMGNGGTLNLESYVGGPVAAVQIITCVVSFPLLHMLGARLGIFPYFFLPKRLRKQEWE